MLGTVAADEGMLDPEESQTAGGRPLVRELAHELRDALSPLASSADLARLRKFDPESSRLLAEKVERGLRRALSILDTFVLAEQCERGTLRLQLRPVPLAEILQSARTALRAADRFSFATAADAVGAVQADAERSAEVLTAVLQHAAAIAAPEDPVSVRAVGHASAPELHVGARLDPDKTPTEEWLTSYRGGDGRMALRTAQRIMRLQGGDLQFLRESETFELVLRFAPGGAAEEADRAAPRAPARPAPRSERILIVEDNPEVRRTYREALLALGYEVSEAADAEQALRMLAESTPDVALIDIHLPRMNGYRLAQAIRARVGAGIYLVMLSGMALDSVTRALAREAGFDECLDKMAGPIALRESLEAGGHRGATS